MKEARLHEIGLAGAFGGLVYWSFCLLRGGLPAGGAVDFDRESWLWVSLLLMFVVGAAAAALMVYLVAQTDRKLKERALVFAVLCGICWEPALTGLQAGFTKTYSDAEVAKTLEDQKSTSLQSAETVEERGQAAAAILEKLPDVQNSQLQKDAKVSVEQTIASIALADSAQSTAALKNIGLAAARTRQTDVLSHTNGVLQGIVAKGGPQAAAARQALSAIQNVRSK